MKNIGRLLVLALVSLSPAIAGASDVRIGGTSLFRFEQSAFPGFAKETVIPATQFLGVDLDKIGDSNLSLHLYGWERLDLSGRSTDEKDNDGDFTYGYLSYRFSKANGEIKAGRFFINEGVAAEQIDGLKVRTDLNHGFTLSMFGGAPVKLDRDKKSKGDWIAGGRGSYRLDGVFELGVSGLHEGNVTLDPAGGPKSDRQLLGGDIWLSPHRTVELNGHTFYNAVTHGIAEHSYYLSIKPHKTLSFSGMYNEERFRNYFTYTNFRSLFNPDNGGELRAYGGGIAWTVVPSLEISADYRRYNRFSNVVTDSNGNSNRYGGEVRLTLLDNKVRSGLSYHRSDSASSFNSYHEGRGYLLYAGSRFSASVDGIVQLYENRIFNKKRSYEVIGSAGVRLLSDLVLSGDVSYGQNPQVDEELRGVVRLTFNYESAQDGAKK
jgi:hypothetical protein